MTESMSARQVLAFIALADAPMPTSIDLRVDAGEIGLNFMRPGGYADLRAWMKLLGATREISGPKFSADGKATLAHCLDAGEIGGHRVVLWSHEPAVPVIDKPLDEQTRAEVRDLIARSSIGGEPDPGQVAAEVLAAREVYEREDPEVTGDPVPPGVEGFRPGGEHPVSGDWQGERR